MNAQPLLFVGKKTCHLYSKVEYSADLKQNRVTVYWGGVRFASFLEKDERPVRNTLAVALASAGISKVDVGAVLRVNPKQVFRYVKQGKAVVEGTPGRPALVDEKIEAFVRSEYLRICKRGRGAWRKEVQELVREKFHRELSFPLLSSIVAPLSKGAYGKGKANGEDSSEKTDGVAPASTGDVTSESGPSDEKRESSLEQGLVAGESTVEQEADGMTEASANQEGVLSDRARDASTAGGADEEETDGAPEPSADAGEAGDEPPQDGSGCEEPSLASEQPTETNRMVHVPFEPPADPTERPEVQARPKPIVVDSVGLELPSHEALEARLQEGFYSRYAAALLLNPFIARLLQGVLGKERSLGNGTPVTLEAFILTFLQMNQFDNNNYESVLKLHPDEFGVLAGLDCSPARSTLYRITPDFLDAAPPLEFASRIAGNYLQYFGVGSRLFFLDGHFQRYFGQEWMAMGYHPQTQRPQKGYYQYVLSGQDGSPLLLLDTDTLLSFTDSIAYFVPKLLPLLPDGVIPLFAFDRGGYEKELLARFAGAEATETQFRARYLCWDLQDDTDYRQRDLDWQDLELELKGNDADHPRLVHFKVAEAPKDVHRGIWANNSPARHHRRLIVRRDYAGPDGVRTLCSPFGTNDWESPAVDLVVALTWRWRLENGFKMGDQDYGFDNLSTYAKDTITPAILQDLPQEFHETIRSRKVPNRAVQQIDKQRRQLQNELGRITERLQRVENGEKVRPDRSKLRLPNDLQALSKLRDERLDQLANLEVERQIWPKQVSRFDRLCEEELRRIDFKKKWKLDILRACAHNVRRLALDTWMSIYPDWRDYTERFRDLLNVGGWLRLEGNVLVVELNTMGQPRFQRAAEAFVGRIHRLQPKAFGPGAYRLRFTFKE